AVAEAAWFADQLSARGFTVAATVVNRLQPTFGLAADTRVPTGVDGPTGAVWRNLAELLARAQAERAALAPMGRDGRPPLVEVPRLAGDVHGPDTLDALAVAMFGR